MKHKYHGNAEWEGTKYPQTGEQVKIPLLPNNVGKKSVNDAGPQQGHDNTRYFQGLVINMNVFLNTWSRSIWMALQASSSSRPSRCSSSTSFSSRFWFRPSWSKSTWLLPSRSWPCSMSSWSWLSRVRKLSWSPRSLSRELGPELFSSSRVRIESGTNQMA